MRLTVRALGLAAYLLVTAAGFLMAFLSPPSVQAAGIYGALGIVWALMFLGGGIIGAFGNARQQVVAESTGSCFVAGAFVVWAVALLAAPIHSTVSYAAALIFFACALTSVRHALMAVSGLNTGGRL